MTTLAARHMARRLTVPFARGADTLALTLSAVSDTQAAVAPYDFAEHQALYDQPPEPRYVLLARRDIPSLTQVTVEYEVLNPMGPTSGSVRLNVPAGTLAGSSFTLDLGVNEGSDTRLRRVRMTPAASGGQAADWWGLIALLGNLAKLLWVIGWERDHVGRHLDRVNAQRRLAVAYGLSLDLLGFDLGVPRFPPLPYAYDPDTVVLYHLDDQPGAPIEVEDIMARYGGVGHHGTNVGDQAQAGVPGRFGSAFAFRTSNAEIEIPNHADFDLAATDSFSVECFVKMEASSAAGHVLAKHVDPATPGQAGWALSVGDFGRGLPGNVRFLVSDGANPVVTLFADEGLSTDRFTHLAGVIDRQADEAHLYLDGVLRAVQPINRLGALTNAEPVRIGRAAGAAFQGVVDEVRLSRVARSTFAPIFGEADESYRRRLRLFEQWTLPTLPDLQRILNEAVGPIGGNTEPLLLDDTDATMVSGTHALTVYPVQLKPGECLDALGNRRVREAEVSGTSATEPTFEPIYLVNHSDSRADYVSPPARSLKGGELPANPQQMQRVTERSLNRLLDLLAAERAAGKLQIEGAFDPRANDLRAVGRGLLLTHSNLGLRQLAALAHRAGFAFVCYRANLGAVYTSVAPGDYVGIEVTGGTATGADAVDLRVGETVNLTVRPTLPADTVYSWLTIACGAGRARFAPRPDRPAVTLEATAPGEVVIKMEATRRHRTVSSTRVFRVGLVELNDGQSIGSDGRLGVGEAVAGEPEGFFHPAFLVTHNDARLTYDNSLNNQRMQPVVAQRLNRLLELIADAGGAGTLQITSAFSPPIPGGAVGLPEVGRALTLRRNPSFTLSAGRLAALAHAAGFSYVKRQDPDLLLRQSVGELVTMSGPRTVAEGQGINLTVGPRAVPQGVFVGANAVYVANSGSDTVSEVDPATGQVRQAFKVGWQPVAVVVSPNGQRLYTANAAGNTVTVIDLATGNSLASIQVNADPVALAHHPTQPRLYVACRTSAALVEIDTNTATVLNSISPVQRPTSLILTANGAELWVALDRDSAIHIIDTGQFVDIDSIALPGQPLGIAGSPDGARAYVTLPQARAVVTLDVAAKVVMNSLAVGGRPGAVAVAPDGLTLYVVDGDLTKERLHILKPDGTPRGVVRLRRQPAGVAASPNRVYVTNQGSDSVSVINPQAGQIGLADMWSLGSGLGERLTWVLRSGGGAKARLSSTTTPVVTLFAEQAGRLVARAVYDLRDNTAPYTFKVRLHPALEAAGTIIRKEQYDLIMNTLNAFHPVGVEVITRAIRERVIEVREGLLNAFPDYTYPNFRVRGPAPRRKRKE